MVNLGFDTAYVCPPFGLGHRIYAQPFAGLGQTLRRGGGFYPACLQETHPLVERGFRNLVEVVDFQHVIFGEDVAGIFALEYLLLPTLQLQQVAIVYATELVAPMVNVILALPKFEIYDVD